MNRVNWHIPAEAAVVNPWPNVSATRDELMSQVIVSKIRKCLSICRPSPYSVAERRVPELISVLVSQPAGDVSHKPGGRLPLLSARPAVTPATLKRAATSFAAW